MPEPRVYALRSLPLADADGAANGRLLILRDTTAYRRAETLLQATFLADASAKLAELVSCAAGDVVFVENSTVGMNVVRYHSSSLTTDFAGWPPMLAKR